MPKGLLLPSVSTVESTLLQAMGVVWKEELFSSLTLASVPSQRAFSASAPSAMCDGDHGTLQVFLAGLLLRTVDPQSLR